MPRVQASNIVTRLDAPKRRTGSHGLPHRLALALEIFVDAEWHGDRKAFQQLMRSRFGPESREGTSYPAVLGYFSGKTSPSLAWIEAAAELFNVCPAWLAFGIGIPAATNDPRLVGAIRDLRSTATAMGIG